MSVCLYLYCSFIYLVAVANSALSSHRTLYYLSLISSVCLRVRDISLIKAQWEKFKRPGMQTTRYFSLIPFDGDWTIGLIFKVMFKSSWTAVLLRFEGSKLSPWIWQNICFFLHQDSHYSDIRIIHYRFGSSFGLWFGLKPVQCVLHVCPKLYWHLHLPWGRGVRLAQNLRSTSKSSVFAT